MPSVRIKENEPFDVALRRFKRSCEKAGVLAKVRSCEFYEKPTWVRKRKAAAAVKRNQKIPQIYSAVLISTDFLCEMNITKERPVGAFCVSRIL